MNLVNEARSSHFIQVAENRRADLSYCSPSQAREGVCLTLALSRADSRNKTPAAVGVGSSALFGADERLSQHWLRGRTYVGR
jgi:hypothetical protein